MKKQIHTFCLQPQKVGKKTRSGCRNTIENKSQKVALKRLHKVGPKYLFQMILGWFSAGFAFLQFIFIGSIKCWPKAESKNFIF